MSPLAQDNNLKCYLPPEMQFAPPKRCGLEAEILGKITKQYDQQRQMQVSDLYPEFKFSRFFICEYSLFYQPQPVVQAPPLRSRPQKQGVQQGTQQVLVISSDSVLDEGGDVIIETAEEHAGQVHIQSLPPNVTTSTPIPQQQRMRSVVQSHTEEAFSSSESETPVPAATSTRTRKQDLSAASKRALPDESDQQEMVQPTKRSRGASETVAVPALRSTRGGSRSTATTSVEVAKSPTKSTDNEEGGTEESSHDEAESYQPARRGRGVRGSKASASQQETATESEDAEEERGNSPPRKSGRRPQPK